MPSSDSFTEPAASPETNRGLLYWLAPKVTARIAGNPVEDTLVVQVAASKFALGWL